MKTRRWQLGLTTLALWGLSLLFALPFLWMLSTSLKTEDHVQRESTALIPRASYVSLGGIDTRVRPLMVKGERLEVQIEEGDAAGQSRLIDPADLHDRLHLHTENYANGFHSFPFGRYLWNTTVLCVITVAGTVLSCSLVAYGLACVQWRGRQLLFAVMLATMMLPGQVTMIPLFMTFKSLGWIDTILPLTVPAFCGNAAFIFLLRQFYLAIPPTLFEAARLDGCSDIGIWARIVLPLSKPALLTVALFTFIAAWNDFTGPLIYLMNDRKYTLSIGLASFQGQYGSDWGRMMAMSLVMTLPVIVLFFLTQKSFLQGVKLTGVKG